MTDRKTCGFTLIELTVVMAILGIFTVLIFPPIVNALNIVTREGAMLRMDNSGHRALGAITAALRQGVLPVITDAKDADGSKARAKTAVNGVGPSKTGGGDIVSFHAVVNSSYGFGKFGAEWRDILEEGTDFLPYAQLVPYIFDDGVSSHDTLDSNFLPQLGIMDQGGRVFRAAEYEVVDSGDADGLGRKRYLLNDGGALRTSIHPSLANLDPEFFGLGKPGGPNLDDARFSPALAANRAFLPADSDKAFGVIRFVPADNLGGAAGDGILSEASLRWDLNGDGRQDSTFALGSLEVVYFPSGDAGITRLPLTTDVVLLQLDAGEGEPEPLFKVRQTDAGGFVVNIDILLCDIITQRKNPLAFNKAVPFLVRRYTSSVELRNMAKM